MPTHLFTPDRSEAPASNRIALIDALRGFALFGIIINHIAMSFLAGPPPPGNEQFNIHSPLDTAFNTAAFHLTFGKFFTIFSFLFGLSFAIQLANAASKERAFALRFLWRLMILFAIGFVHNMFFSGDILVIYAALGLLLLPARYLGNKLLLPLALLLVVNTPSLIQSLLQLNAPPPSQAQIAANIEGGKAFAKVAQEQFSIKQSGSLLQVVQMNAIGALVMKLWFQLMTGRLWVTFGLFLLGMYAGRKKIFQHNESNQQFFKRLCLWSGLTAVVSTIFAAFYGNPFGGAGSLLQVMGNFSFNIHQASLSAFYVSGIVLLYWRASNPVTLNLLVPVGQMGLTTYLLQSVFGLLLFYGFGLGLLGKIGVAASIGLGICFFFLQILFARWWMARYPYGAVEWVWRSLTYFRMQPMRRLEKDKTVEQPAGPAVVILNTEGAANKVEK
jgi:uncharacterized protein